MILLVIPNAASPRVFPMFSGLKGDWVVVVVVVGRKGRLGMLMPLPAIPDITLPMLSIPGNSNWADGALLFRLCGGSENM